MSAQTEARQAEIESQNEAACPVVQAIEQVGTAWRLNVIHALEGEELRFNELKRATDARSKTLSDTLEDLVEVNVVSRRMEEDSPIAVYYSLTEKGEELSTVLQELGGWADRWSDRSSPQ